MLCDELKDLKSTSKLTAKEISHKSGVPESTLSRIFSGETPDPSAATVAKIVVAMGGSLDIIYGISHEINYRDELIEQCRSDIAHERRNNKRLLLFAAGLFAFLALFLILDIAISTAGWIRY